MSQQDGGRACQLVGEEDSFNQNYVCVVPDG